jgi:hypothetical protein
MLEGVLSLFDDPIADLVTVGILVSIFLHNQEMRVLQKRMDKLSFQVSDLKILIATIPSVGAGPLSESARAVDSFSGPAATHLALTQTRISESLKPLQAPSPAPWRSHDPTGRVEAADSAHRPNRNTSWGDRPGSEPRSFHSRGQPRV